MAGSMALPQGLENVMQSLTKSNNVESWEVMSHVQSDTTNVFIKFQKKISRGLVSLPRGEVSLFQKCYPFITDSSTLTLISIETSVYSVSL